MNVRETFLDAAVAAGCPEDQTRNFVAAHLWLQRRQLAASAAARLCDLPDGPTAVGYGGARGGGKSHWLLAQLGADDCQRVPGLKCLLLRKVGKANLEHFEDLRQKLFRHLPHEFSAYRGVLTFPNGSRVIAGHFQNESDIDAYLGLEYDAIGIEEATTLTYRKYQDITTCCRSSKTYTPAQPVNSGLGFELSTFNLQLSSTPWRPRIYSTSNPGGVGHAWYKRMFVDPHLERLRSFPSAINHQALAGSGLSTLNPQLSTGLCLSGPSTLNAQLSTIFVPARVDDNRYNNPEYRKVLEGLSGWQKRAWLDGDWDIAAGQFFTTFRREAHVLPDFDDSRAVEWFCALDYGFTHYTVCLLGCRDSDGNGFVVDEHSQRLWLPQRHAAAIKAMLGRHSVRLDQVRRFVAGADVFSRQSDGTTVAAQYAKQGISLRPANTDRVNGWAEILQGLGDVDAGLQPTLFIHQRCARLLDTLPALQHDPNRPEDVLKVDADENGHGGDDAADALRYLVATRSRTLTERKLAGV